MLDELYSDTIQITKKLESFLNNLQIRAKEIKKTIRYFVFDSDFNKREELYILNLKKSDSKTSKAHSLHSIQDNPTPKKQTSSYPGLESNSSNPMLIGQYDNQSDFSPLHFKGTGKKDLNPSEIICLGVNESPKGNKAKQLEKLNDKNESPDNSNNEALQSDDFSKNPKSQRSDKLLSGNKKLELLNNEEYSLDSPELSRNASEGLGLMDQDQSDYGLLAIEKSRK